MCNVKVGLSTMTLQKKYGDKEAIRIAAACGADAVDFMLDMEHLDVSKKDSIYSQGENKVTDYFKEIKAYADNLGIEICQTHGRMAGFKDKEEEDRILIQNASLDMLATKILGAPTCVLHSVTTIFMGPDCEPQRMRDLNKQMFLEILPYAKQYGVKVAMETFGDAVTYDCCDFFGNIKEFTECFCQLKEVEEYADYITVCVDTGHSNKAMRFGNPNPADVIRSLGEQVTVLHLNDNDTFTDQHKIPMTGNINWTDVLDALEEVHFHGVYNMELLLNQFGEEFDIETAEFAVRLMKHMLKMHKQKKSVGKYE